MAFTSANVTVTATRPDVNGKVIVFFTVTGDNAYPAAGYDLFGTAGITTKLGIKNWEINDAGTGFVDPIVIGVNQQGFLAEIVGGKLLVSYATGGATASPTTPAAPIVTAGATPVTSTAATGVLTPGNGKACAANTDLSGASVKFFCRTAGYVN